MQNTTAVHRIYTIGHSTRSLSDFLTLLTIYQVGLLLDVRSLPRSGRFPHFNQETLALALKQEGIVYRHFSELGGLRKASKDSVNEGWRNQGFRGFADHMQTENFWGAVDEVCRLATAKQLALMCAEALPWRCHRWLISDALVVKGLEARHIVSSTTDSVHQLTSFAVVKMGRITYRRRV